MTEQTYKEKKQWLANISNQIKKAKAMGGIDSSLTINEILKEFYKISGKELNTFCGWKEKGYKVKKGEKAFLFWSKPVAAKKSNEEQSEELKEYKFFNLCYLFSSDQVEKI